MTETVSFRWVQLVVLLNLLNIRIGGAPSWVVRGLDSESVDLARLERLRERLAAAFDAAKPADPKVTSVEVAVEPSEINFMLAAVGPLMRGDRLQESECHALTGGNWSEAVDLITWMAAFSEQHGPAL